MQAPGQAQVAVLLATYNGARFIEAQLQSLRKNVTPFALHWIDDRSTDETRAVLRESVRRMDIELFEWHRHERLGVPAAYFHLIENAAADIYMFCDQDDIWQPGKIDATAANLLPDRESSVLCFSDPLVFNDAAPEVLRRFGEVNGLTRAAALQASRSFMHNPAVGNTMGFTRPLRELFLKHNDIARAHARMHDWWMYLIAHASGVSRMLDDVPTTLYRQHAGNTLGAYLHRGRSSIERISRMWGMYQEARHFISRQAAGFVLASKTLPPSPKLEQLVAHARRVATLDKRQSPAAIAHLLRRDMMPGYKNTAFWMAATCLCCDAGS